MEIKSTNVFFLFRKKLLEFFMRAIILLLCTGVFGLSPFEIMSQNAEVTIPKDQKLTVDQVFNLIREQTDYRFIYKSDMFTDYPEIEVQKGTIKANKLLEKSLQAGDFKFYISSNNTVTIKKTSNLQELEISGVVKDKNGIPIPGLTVYVTSREPGSGPISSDFIVRGTTTNIDGNFKLKAETGYYLIVSGLGYEFFKTQITGGQTVFEITLKELVSALDEVVIVGYGSTIRKDLTGTVGSVSSKQLTEVKSQTVDQALVGQVSGVFVESNSGAPGSGATINIRGLSQISGDNQPLYVIDGVPIVVNTNFGIGVNAGAGNRENPLLAIDPNNIERVDVLKDASAAAIYGSRAANGVILVTTKRGKLNQAPKFNFSYSATFQNPTEKLNFLNTDQYKEFATNQAQPSIDAFINGLLIPRGIPEPLWPTFIQRFFPVENAIVNDPDNFFGNANTDWQDKILNRNALWNQYNMNVSGGTSLTDFYVSGTVSDQQGVFLGNKFQRYNFSTNINSQIKDYLKIGGSINYTYSINKQSGVNSLFSADFRPDLPVFNDDFSFSSIVENNRERINPLGNEATIRDKAIAQNLFGSLYAEIAVLKNLKFKTQFNVGLSNDKSNVFWPSFTSPALLSSLQDGTNGGILNTQLTEQYTTSFSNTLNYTNTLNNEHKLNVVFGLAWDKTNLNVENHSYEGFPDDNLLTNIGSANNVFSYGNSTIESGINSVFGRLEYAYKDRYLATFTARSDGSTKFGPENQRGFFPSMGLAWNVHNENFFAENSPISQLKLRASFGRTGNDNLPAFAFLPFYTALGNDNFYDGNSGIAIQNLPNSNIKWETTDQLDLGLEFGLFNNRLNAEVVYFEKNTSDLILFSPVPAETGFQEFVSNIADVSNKGWEFTIGGDVVRSDNFTWNSSFNLTFYKNKVESLNGGTNQAVNPFLPSLNGIQEGEPIGFIQGYDVVRIAQTQEEITALNDGAPDGNYFSDLTAPGDYIFRDVNGDGEITSEDQINLGDINPDFYGGFNNSLSYKNFDMGFSIQFVSGNSREFVAPEAALSFVSLQRNQQTFVLDSWTEDNRDATYARMGSRTHRNSSRTVVDGSYVRLRSLSLGYTLPNDIVNKLGLQSARIYLAGNNLITITDYPGQDPENVTTSGSNSSIDRRRDLGNNYPQVKNFTVGINLNF